MMNDYFLLFFCHTLLDSAHMYREVANGTNFGGFTVNTLAIIATKPGHQMIAIDKVQPMRLQSVHQSSQYRQSWSIYMPTNSTTITLGTVTVNTLAITHGNHIEYL